MLSRIIAALVPGLLAGGATERERIETENALSRYDASRRRQRRVRGETRRSSYALGIALGLIQIGTRAKNRGPYPAHMSANCEKMRARNAKRVKGRGLSYESLELKVDGQTYVELDSIRYGSES